MAVAAVNTPVHLQPLGRVPPCLRCSAARLLRSTVAVQRRPFLLCPALSPRNTSATQSIHELYFLPHPYSLHPFSVYPLACLCPASLAALIPSDSPKSFRPLLHLGSVQRLARSSCCYKCFFFFGTAGNNFYQRQQPSFLYNSAQHTTYPLASL